MAEPSSRWLTSRTVLLIVGSFILGVLTTVGITWFMIYQVQSHLAEHDFEVAQNPEARLFQAASNLAKATDEYDRWVALGDVGMWNVDAGSLEKAKVFAEELLSQAPRYEDDGNYGNAIHKSHTIHGRIELRQGNRAAAIQHLLQSGNTPGSPQLDSFGPNMTLAKELLEVGERKAVLEYIDLCGRFWKLDFGRLAKWKEMVRNDHIPNCMC